MRAIDLKSFDLNLLLVFDTLMRERHVGRAGEALGRGQPAISHALARLRHIFNDPLFVRCSGGVEPTPGAYALASPIATALSLLRNGLNGPGTFDPADLARTVVIGASDYIDLTLMPPLLRELRRLAPGLNVRRQPATRQSAIGQLRRRELDLVIGPLDAAPPTLETTPLFEERLVVIARRDHPILHQDLTLASLSQADHLLVSPAGDSAGTLDSVLRQQGLSRRVMMTVPQFLAAPFIIASTDLIAVLAERVAQRLGGVAGVAIHPQPAPAPTWKIALGRLANAVSDPALDWLVELTRHVANGIDQRDQAAI